MIGCTSHSENPFGSADCGLAELSFHEVFVVVGQPANEEHLLPGYLAISPRSSLLPKRGLSLPACLPEYLSRVFCPNFRISSSTCFWVSATAGSAAGTTREEINPRA